jgi:hypothetical protein
LCKNGFLSNYGRTSVNDIFSSTIPYKRFEPNEGRYFSYYIENEFGNKNIPGMSDGLRGKFLQSLLEVFQNSVTHSHTKMGIYACGQYFHKNSWSNFTIVDLGRGIRNNLLEEIGKDLPPEQAIHWAMEGNTTKKGIPGGLGLKLLREFAQLNQGTIQVVSDQGYWWQQHDGNIEIKIMTYPFPGTLVNIGINTADPKSYILVSENTEDIPF